MSNVIVALMSVTTKVGVFVVKLYGLQDLKIYPITNTKEFLVVLNNHIHI